MLDDATSILIVEDEFMVSMMLDSDLRDLGAEKVTSKSKLTDGLEAARAGDFSFAILDVNLNGEESFPIADVLRERKIPFMFATGYGREGVDDRFADCTVLTKPYTTFALQDAIKSILSSQGVGEDAD